MLAQVPSLLFCPENITHLHPFSPATPSCRGRSCLVFSTHLLDGCVSGVVLTSQPDLWCVGLVWTESTGLALQPGNRWPGQASPSGPTGSTPPRFCSAVTLSASQELWLAKVPASPIYEISALSDPLAGKSVSSPLYSSSFSDLGFWNVISSRNFPQSPRLVQMSWW